jgi:hypothetical protein
MGEGYHKLTNTSSYWECNGTVDGLNTLSSPDPYHGVSHSSGVDLFTNSLNGELNPSWRSQIKAGANASTPASGSITRCSRGSVDAFSKITRVDIPGATIYENQFASGTPNLNFSRINTAAADVQARVHNHLISKWVSQVQSIQSSFEAGQDLGEWKQTRDAMIRPLSSLQDHVLGYFDKLKKVRHGLSRNSGSSRKVGIAKALNDAYLEWTFGWNPLVSDIAKAYVGLQTRNDRMALVPISVSAHEDYSATDDTEIVPLGPSNLSVQFSRKVKSTYTERIKGAIRNNLVNGQQPVADILQLAPRNFIPTVWDLLPYSFIVDYFLNIGNILQAYSMNFSDVAWGNFTTRTLTTSDYAVLKIAVAIPGPPSYISSFGASGGNSYFSCVNFTRDVLKQDMLIPSLQFSLPLGSKKPWINMASLLFARVEKFVPFF